MNNLVLGSEGFLGKRLCKFLEEKNENVVKIDIKNSISQDLRTLDFSLENIDRVYFLAWEVGGSKYLYRNDTQKEQIEHNNELMLNVFKKLYDIPFVFTSSQLANDYNSVYGVQKRMGEIWTKLTNKGVSVRLWNLYGYIEEYDERSHVISDLIYQAINFNEIVLKTSGNEARQFVHIDDICRGLYESFNVEDRTQVYDLTNKEWTKIIDVTNIISEITKCDVKISEIDGSTTYLEEYNILPNWSPEISLNDGLYKMIKK